MKSINDIIWDTTTGLVADTIALFSPAKATAYRKQRDLYRSASKRAYVATELKGPYQSFRPTMYSGDREVATANQKVTSKVRDLARNNPLVAGVELKRTTAVVGDEIGIKAQILDANKKPNSAINQVIDERFYRWAESAEAGGWSLTKCFHLIENHLLSDGEILVKGSILPERGSNPFRIQLFEKDHLIISEGLFGIDYNEYGKPLAYHLYKAHPGGVYPLGSGSYQEHITVPAEDMFHVVENTRCSQRRGISPLASSVYKLYGVDDLEDAELIASRQGAAFGIIIKSKTPEINLMGEPTSEEEQAATDSKKQPRQWMDAGGILELEEGEDAQAFNSDRPNSNFDNFIRSRERKAIGTTGMSYELGSGDFSQSNYSASKMARNMEWQVILRRQKVLKTLLNWIYRQWLKYEIALFGIPGISASAYNRNPVQYESVTWQLAGNQGVEILKEIQAAKEEISVCAQSLTDWCAERGRDFPELVKKRADENEILKASGFAPIPFTLGPIVSQATADPMTPAPVTGASKGNMP